ncbi:MAG: phosphotransacetylase family protein [Firmicutes bacterium]|nr:phosphotransacetylase family protein [Bacillota bacterium]MCL5038886.1 phosphotransacetylase family protein [Bacillota bacterium]
MKSLYVMGNAGSGKTAVCLGLALKLQEQGLKVAYFKPVGAGRPEDEDAILMHHVLKMKEPLEVLVPVTTSAYYLTRYRNPEESLERVLHSFERVSKGADLTVIEGTTSPQTFAGLGLDAFSLANRFKSMALTIKKIENDLGLDTVLFYNEHLRAKGINFLGTIFNNVPRPILDKTLGVYKPILERRDFRVLGVIPKNPSISSPTVQQYYDILGGEILEGEEKMDLIVEEVLIGAMTLDSALEYFRRTPNKAVVTGGDRADVALAALETNTSVLILTGGLYPSVNVLTRAHEKGVPVILVHYDTFTTVEKLHEVTRKIRPNDARGIALAKSSLENNCDWSYILEAAQK